MSAPLPSLDDVEMRICASSASASAPNGGAKAGLRPNGTDEQAASLRASPALGPTGGPSRAAALAAYHAGAPPGGPGASPSARSIRSSAGSAPGGAPSPVLPPAGYPPTGAGARAAREGGAPDGRTSGSSQADAGGAHGGGAHATNYAQPSHAHGNAQPPPPPSAPAPDAASRLRPTLDRMLGAEAVGAPHNGAASGPNGAVPLPTMAPPSRGYRPVGERAVPPKGGGATGKVTGMHEDTVASRGAAAAQTANEPAGGVGDGRAMAGGDEGEGRGGGMAVGCPSGRASIGVVVMVFFFFAPLVGLFALSTLSERAQRAPPPFWCVAVPEGDVDSASGMVPSALAYANRSSGLQAGYSDLPIDPADGCLRGCEPTAWPPLSQLPPDLAFAAAAGAFDVRGARREQAVVPATGAPVRLLALSRQLAPRGAEMAAACSEHDRCYATWRRRLPEAAHRAACDGELVRNLAHACARAAAGAEPGGARARGADARFDGCEQAARLTHFLVTSTADYARAQEAAESAVVRAAMAAVAAAAGPPPLAKSRVAESTAQPAVSGGSDGAPFGPTEGDVADWATAHAGSLVGAVYADALAPTSDATSGAAIAGEQSERPPLCEVLPVRCG